MTDGVNCIVLAAGTASRFGASKMLADIDGEPMIRRVVRAVRQAAVGPVHVVTGHDAERIESAVAGLCDGCAHNPLYRDGIGTSIAAGVASLPSNCDAALIILGDQPLLSAEHLTRL
ncbi:MAG TPA: nucleotidyltransferase family protein, partial [Woeseiaceae bacterium]|nr:nucleotidyltransferase family protein [Woeseiaceae bacterium]